MRISFTFEITRYQPQDREVDMGSYIEHADPHPIGFHAPLHTEEDE